jgi:hypothetical protein
MFAKGHCPVASWFHKGNVSLNGQFLLKRERPVDFIMRNFIPQIFFFENFYLTTTPVLKLCSVGC